MVDSDIKLLIVDDDDAIRNSFNDFFEDHNWNVFSAETAEEALKLVENEKPDAALVDIRLAEMNGDEFIFEADKIHSDMICVICTGSPDFNLEPQLKALPQVSGNLFMKPVGNLLLIEEELIMMLQKRGKEKKDELND